MQNCPNSGIQDITSIPNNPELLEIVKFVRNCVIWLKLWNLAEIVKFGWKCEIRPILWNLAEIVKFDRNCEIWSKLWNLINKHQFCKVSVWSGRLEGLEFITMTITAIESVSDQGRHRAARATKNKLGQGLLVDSWSRRQS